MSHATHSYCGALTSVQIETCRLAMKAHRNNGCGLSDEVTDALCDLAIKGLGGPSGGNLPSGWLAVPVRPTIAMHNAAALSDVYELPRIEYNDAGALYIRAAAPDYSRVWRLMIEASPQVPSTATTSPIEKEKP